MTASQRRFVPLLLLYLVALFALALRPSSATGVQSLNLVPFSSIMRGLRVGGPLFAINIVGNIVVFMPLGVLLPNIHPRFRSWASTMIIALGVSTLIEVLQFISAQRVTDVDDLLLNALGALLGYGCYALLRQ